MPIVFPMKVILNCNLCSDFSLSPFIVKINKNHKILVHFPYIKDKIKDNQFFFLFRCRRTFSSRDDTRSSLPDDKKPFN